MSHSEEQMVADIKLANTRTVDALQRVYAMVIALALTTGVTVLIETLGIIKGAREAPTNWPTGRFLCPPY